MSTERPSPRYSGIDVWDPSDILDAIIEGQFAAKRARERRPAVRARDGHDTLHAREQLRGLRALARGIEHDARVHGTRRVTNEVDRAVSARGQVWVCGAHEPEHGERSRAPGRLHVVLGGVEQQCVPVRLRVVHEDVEATGASDRLRDETLGVGQLAHVGPHGERGATACPDLGARVVEGVLRASADDDRRARGRERQRDAAPQASTSTSDAGHAVAEIGAHRAMLSPRAA